MTQEIRQVMIPRDEYILPDLPSVVDVASCRALGRHNAHPSHTTTTQPTTAQKRLIHLLSQPKETKKLKSKSFQYVCKLPGCGEKFIHSEYLNTHMKLHQGVKPFTCNICGKVCQTESKLKVHHATHDSDGVKPICDLCERTFSSRSALTKHKKILHKPKPYVCPNCNAGFEKHKYMAIHMKRAHDDVPPKEISEPASSQSALKSLPETSSPGRADEKNQPNYSMPRGQEALVVPVSSVPISTYQIPIEHTRQCEMVKKGDVEANVPISCEMCTSTFPSLAYLEQHMAVHLTERTFANPSHDFSVHHRPYADPHSNGYGHTNSGFSQFVPTLVQPSAPRATPVFEKYICSSCSEQFLNLGSLKRHQAQHMTKHCQV
ncbi:hypothetical protein Pmani_003130 [Petrolisthes manimaculis]|uniref:C2H2-type domain-containing protein n=1 Tax=Petrolisthes manimaculis TaxID=1843537 RepID=A0AAE1QHD3_9EUCA|nr:hypothetical protein Pmani_003130 [Petrolisthes manimaculis]